METRVLSFRLPLGWPELLDHAARQYHFASRGEMLRLILIEAALNVIKGKLKVKGTISPPTLVIACRLPVATLEAIRCCKQVKDTPSVWAGLVVAKWVKDLNKENSRQQKKNPVGYRFFIEDYAKHFRDRVAVYNINRGKYEG